MKPLKSGLGSFAKFIELVEKTIDFEALEEGNYRIKAEFDPTLAELKETLDEVKDKINRVNEKETERLGMTAKTLTFENNPVHGFFFRLVKSVEVIMN